MKLYTIIIAVLIMTSGCSGQSTDEHKADQPNAAEQNEGEVLKVFVSKKGVITMNGSKVTLDELDKALSELGEKKGTVYYSRANITGNPPEESMQVIELVIKHELNLKFYTDQTFSTPVKVN